MRSGNAEEMEKIPLGGFTKLANPHAALAFDLIGPDAAQPVLAPPPRMDSAERAAEMVELYWHALLRDLRFADYESSPLVKRACDELTSLRTFSGPRAGGKVTPYATGLDQPTGLAAFQGLLFVADKQRIWRIGPKGKAEVLPVGEPGAATSPGSSTWRKAPVPGLTVKGVGVI